MVGSLSMGVSGWRSREWGSRGAGHGDLGLVESRGGLGLIHIWAFIIFVTLTEAAWESA